MIRSFDNFFGKLSIILPSVKGRNYSRYLGTRGRSRDWDASSERATSLDDPFFTLLGTEGGVVTGRACGLAASFGTGLKETIIK